MTQLSKNQKALTFQPRLFDAVGSGLAPHSPKRAIRVSIGYPAFGFYPPIPPQFDCNRCANKNNLEKHFETAFSSLQSVIQSIETRYHHYTKPRSDVNASP